MMGFPGVGVEVMTPAVLILREGVDLQVATIAFLVATIAFLVATIARWWTIQKRHQPKKSTAWPRWLHGRLATFRFGCLPGSHHRQMVDYFVLDVDRSHPPRGRVG
jgi:hypothetical protein